MTSRTGLNNFQQTKDAGFIICLDDWSSDTIPHCNLIKTDKFGTIEWSKQFTKGRPNYNIDDANCVYQTSDGGYIIATSFQDSIYQKIYLIKMDNLGNVQWSHLYPGLGTSKAYCIIQTANLDYVIAGYTVNLDAVDPFYGPQGYAYLFKVDSNGNYLWGNMYASPAYEAYRQLNTVKEIPGGGYIAAGLNKEGAFLLNTDINGNLIWSKAIGEFRSMINSILISSTGHFICTGSMYSPTENFQVFLMDLDASGNIVWTKEYNPILTISPAYGQNFGWVVKQTPDQGYAIAVLTRSDSPLNFLKNPSIIKTDTNGNLLWSKQYYDVSSMGMSGAENLALDVTADHGLALTFQNYYTIAKTYFLKTDSLGQTGCLESDFPFVESNIHPTTLAQSFSQSCGTATAISTHIYPISVSDTTICETNNYDSTQTSINDYLLIPNVFTPNGDDINDHFKIDYHENSAFEIKIYNRWGEIVFARNDNTIYWNGKINNVGNDAPDGTYYYIVQLSSPADSKKTYKGFLTLLR